MRILQVGCGALGGIVLKKYSQNYYQIEVIDKFNAGGDFPNIPFYKDFNELKNTQYDIIIISVKPQNYREIIDDLSNIISNKTTIISIMAGIDVDRLAMNFANTQSFARIMPNIGMIFNAGVSSVYYRNCDKNIIDFVNIVFGGENILIKIDEDKTDTLTPIIGSGMVFFLLVGKILRSIAIEKFKIDENLANNCIKNLLESSFLFSKQDENFEDTIKKIASKGGITEEICRTIENDLSILLQNGVQNGIEKAIDLKKNF